MVDRTRGAQEKTRGAGGRATEAGRRAGVARGRADRRGEEEDGGRVERGAGAGDVRSEGVQGVWGDGGCDGEGIEEARGAVFLSCGGVGGGGEGWGGGWEGAGEGEEEGDDFGGGIGGVEGEDDGFAGGFVWGGGLRVAGYLACGGLE